MGSSRAGRAASGGRPVGSPAKAPPSSSTTTASAERQRTAAEIEAGGGHATSVQADVTGADEVERLMEAVAEFAGDSGLHLLFNNAGIYPAGSLEEVSIEDWDRVIAVNVRGPFLCTKAALPLLRRAAASAGRARVVNIGSVMPYLESPASSTMRRRRPRCPASTHSLARELAPDGITVNCIVPSQVATETAHATAGPGWEPGILAQQAVQRVQQPGILSARSCFSPRR